MTKLFGTDGVRGVANQYPMTADFALTLGKACGQFLCKNKKKVALAKDTRLSGDMLENALIAGFTSQGIDVLKLGIIPTPALTSLTASLNVDMAIMITASHNPYTDNGIKLLNNQGDRFDDETIATLENMVAENNFTTSPETVGTVSVCNDAALLYMENAAKVLNGQKLTGLRVVLDCANGAFSAILPEVFMKLGAGVIVIGNKPNGQNINKDCGSQHTEQLSKMVCEAHAHIGIAVDGDGDRIIIVDELGNRLDGDQIIAFLAKTLQANGSLKNNCAVATILSNIGLDKYLQTLGIKVYRSAVGEKNVILKMREIGANLGGEESGHMVLSDFSRTGDGMVTALTVAQGYLSQHKKMSELFPIFQPYPCSEVDTYFADKDELLQAAQDAEVLAEAEKVRTLLGADGNVIVRKSGTEPLVKVKIMGIDYTQISVLNEQIRQGFKKYKIEKTKIKK
ncbi:MAG: phosphoglucosamine mutase [Alphaproteobacteria bacterium]|nr:phosphoglucosamine mutase [Alphaproteobacteria bacterium]